MRVIIKGNGSEKEFPLPMKSVLRLLLSKKDMTEQEKKQRKRLLREAVACLKAYKVKNGSFVLLDAQEASGEGVKIII